MNADMRAALQELIEATENATIKTSAPGFFRMVAAVEKGRKALASQPEQPAECEAVGFRYRVRGAKGGWAYVDHRSPDSFEIRECEIESLYIAPPAPAVPEKRKIESWMSDKTAYENYGWNACRAAMLAAPEVPSG